jgi:glyoxylase-like metal-dependent hydrolase (beta-lactamase superfamily II)
MTKDPVRKFIFGDAPEAEVEAALKSYGGISPGTQIQFNYLLAERDEYATLIDTGCGDQAENEKNPNETAGLLVASLEEAGFDVSDVNTVIISHCHWDHFGGAVTGGKPTFPKAEYMMSAREAEHIRKKPEGWASKYMRVLGDRLKLLPDITEAGPGVIVRVSPGHTPGITLTELSSGGEILVYTSDLIIHQAHIEHLEWIPSFETDKKAASVSRTMLVEDAHKQGLTLFVPHIPSVLGKIGRGKSGYYWITTRASSLQP